jgi:hypothetical protein
LEVTSAGGPLAMTTEEFRSSIKDDAPPAELPLPLQALWWDARGNWERAHEAAQSDNSAECAWAHAYLHRKEGDIGNAGYWYRIARKPVFAGPLEEEADAMLAELLR